MSIDDVCNAKGKSLRVPKKKGLITHVPVSLAQTSFINYKFDVRVRFIQFSEEV